MDHIVPRSQRGTDAMGNLVLACEPCNVERGTMDFATFFRLKRPGDTVPARKLAMAARVEFAAPSGRRACKLGQRRQRRRLARGG